MRPLTRPLLTALGLLLTAIGAVGLVLPLLPTTPFLLLAGFCFSRSSPRLHRWLLASPALGPLIGDWEQHRAIRGRAKWLCSVLLVGATGWPIGTGRVPSAVVPVVALTVIGVLSFIWTRPDHPDDASRSSGPPD